MSKAAEDATMKALGAAIGLTARSTWAATKLAARTTYKVTNGVLSVGGHGVLPKLPVLRRLHDPVSDVFRKLGFKVCFAGKTPIRTPWGWSYIEDLCVGDWVLSRDENDPNGAVVAKQIQEKFVREGLLWKLRILGIDILSTAEHPFYVRDKGWMPLHSIVAGDYVWSEVSGWLCVDAVEDTGEWTTVYNVCVADYHTYFVGETSWALSRQSCKESLWTVCA